MLDAIKLLGKMADLIQALCTLADEVKALRRDVQEQSATFRDLSVRLDRNTEATNRLHDELTRHGDVNGIHYRVFRDAEEIKTYGDKIS